MALYIPHSIFHLAWLLYVRPETFGPYYINGLELKSRLELKFAVEVIMLYSCYKDDSGVVMAVTCVVIMLK